MGKNLLRLNTVRFSKRMILAMMNDTSGIDDYAPLGLVWYCILKLRSMLRAYDFRTFGAKSEPDPQRPPYPHLQPLIPLDLVEESIGCNAIGFEGSGVVKHI